MSLLEAIKTNNIVQVRELILTEQLSWRTYRDLLGEAAEAGYLEIVQILIDATKHLPGASFQGAINNALLLAANEGHLEVVKTLLAVGAKSYLSEEYDKKDVHSALILAAQEGHFEIVKALVEAGAVNVNENTEHGSAIWMAAVSGHEEMFNYLAPLSELELRQQAEEILSHGIQLRKLREAADPRSNALTDAISHNNIEEVKKIPASNLNVNAFDADGSTPLLNAVITGEVHLVKLLLEAGANPNLGDHVMAETPIIGAIQRGITPNCNSICSALISGGADINAQTYDGMTALMWAARFGNLELINLFLQAGADVNLQDSEKKTAMDYALHYSKANSWYKCNQYPEVIQALHSDRTK